MRITIEVIIWFFCATATCWADEVIKLSLPIKCVPGVDCFVQNYVDDDPSTDAHDYQCGRRTYEGHTGTDIRIPDLQLQHRGVMVIAAAEGTVKAVRDGVADVSVRIGGKSPIAGIECGNGVVVEHGEGWSTQYCHLAKNSVVVKVGQHVDTGQMLGLVGMSGDTEFPHVHLAVRLNGKIVDPFAFGATPASCAGGASLWEKSTADTLQYREGEIINFGFSAAPVDMNSIETGGLTSIPMTKESPAIVAYARSIGLRAGDTQVIRIKAPNGSTFSEYTAQPLEKDRAQVFVSTGRKRTTDSWPAGRYVASYEVVRGSHTVLQRSFAIEF